jgi:hypothetical protein
MSRSASYRGAGAVKGSPPMKNAKLPAMLPETFAEAEMIETTAHWLDLVAANLSTKSSHGFLRARLKTLIRQGTIPAVRVIEWANAGVVDCDEALREVSAEMLDHGEEIPNTIRGYMAQALLKDRGPHGKDAGRIEIATGNWLRDQCIAVVVSMIVERWNLRVTRGRASHRPSACSVMSAALVKRGIIMGEHRVEAIHKSLADLLVQHRARVASRPI